jgi:hypothetical protein
VELVVAVDGTEWTCVRAPRDLGARAWVLGVVAVQLNVEDGKVRALVRASLTGTEAQTRTLEHDAIVQVALVEEGARPTWPSARLPPGLQGVAATFECALDGEMLESATITVDQTHDQPPRRAFAHVYCRWLRDGTTEPGFDLTDFLSKPPGEMYERKLHRPLAVGQVVSYSVHLA